MQTGSTTLQDLFDLYKKKLLEQIDSVSIFDDASEYEESFHEIEMKVKAMASLIQIRLDLNIDNSSYTPTPQIETPVIIDDIKEEANQAIYVFERKLRGGLVHLPDADYFIPEQMVRDMNVTHGDEVEITGEYMHKGMKRFNFRIVNRIGEPLKNRIQLDEYVVTSSEDSKSLILHSDINGNREVFEHTYHISHNDIANYSIEEGSVVDAAYYEDNPEGISIIFKHPVTVDAKTHVKKYPRQPVRRLPLDILYLHSPSLDHSEEDELFLNFIDTHFKGNHIISYGVEMEETLVSNMRNCDVIFFSNAQFNSKAYNYMHGKMMTVRGTDAYRKCYLLPKTKDAMLTQLHNYKKELLEGTEASI